MSTIFHYLSRSCSNFSVVLSVHLRVIGMLILLLLSSCQMGETKHAASSSTLLLTQHPLVGKIWDVTQQEFIDEQALVNEVLDSRYVLLGETHDNIVHHEKQAWILSKLAKYPGRIGVAFEMIDTTQGERIKDVKIKSSTQLIDYLNKDKTGWDYTGIYKPLFDEVIKANFTIYPANFGRDDMMKYLSKGEDLLPEDIKAQLSANALNAINKVDMEKEIVHSHCDMANPEMVKAMLLGQRVRDALMTLSMLEAKDDKVVLVAGSGHTRNDRGVPVYIRKKDQYSKILSLAWVEVSDEDNDPEPYAARWGAEALPFDYVWFTPQEDRVDPCESFLKHMQKKK